MEIIENRVKRTVLENGNTNNYFYQKRRNKRDINIMYIICYNNNYIYIYLYFFQLKYSKLLIHNNSGLTYKFFLYLNCHEKILKNYNI